MAELANFEKTEAVLQEYATEFMRLFPEQLRSSDREATGNLIQSIRTKVVTATNTVAVDVELAKYWQYVEWDTRPHWPPSGCLLEWIKARRLPVHETKGDGLPTPKQLDFIIRRKISRVGTKGSHDMRTTVQQLNAEYTERIADAVAEDVGRLADAIISSLF